jgi:hypothetical protein
MNPLKSRKQLLIAESELNRVQLVQELQTMADEVHALANQARTIGSLASTAASLVTGLVSFRRKKSASAAEKPSWWQTILKGAQLAGSLWSEIRPRSRNRDDI